MSQATQRQSGLRTVEHAGETVAESARRLAPAAGKATLGVIRHPDTVVKGARRLQTAAPVIREAIRPILTGRVDDWRSEWAYSLGLQAFAYGFPYVHNARLRHRWMTDDRNPDVVPYAAVNHFWHARRLLDANFRDGGCPNNDTLYSLAWLDLRKEPVVLSHPDMGRRYFSFELTSFASDNFGYIGQRTTGSGAGSFAVAGPGWKGDLLEGVQAVSPSPTPWALVLGRTLVNGASDVAAVAELQARFRLTPLSLWTKTKAVAPERHDVYAPADPAEDPLAVWRTLNTMLAENPPPAHHGVLLEQFARVGVGAGLDVDDQPEVVRHGLMRAAAIGMPLLRRQFLSGDWANVVNGWRYPPPEEGRFGDDYLRRAADQSLAGIVANDPAEAVYLVNFSDSDGRHLSGRVRYEPHFERAELPPVDAFWSRTAYTGDMNLIPNPVDRYSVGDRTPGLVHDPGGGLTTYMQPGPPGPEREPNWLPTSPDHDWFVILRMYRPHPGVVESKWRCPGLVRVG